MRSGIPSPLDGFPSPFGPKRKEDEEQQQEGAADEQPQDDQTDQKS